VKVSPRQPSRRAHRLPKNINAGVLFALAQTHRQRTPELLAQAKGAKPNLRIPYLIFRIYFVA
jgi:hypothetical protein